MGEDAMNEEDQLAALMSGDADGDTEEVQTHAGPVTVRALTRGEVLRLRTGRELGKLSVGQFEARMVSLAVVRPKVTEEQVTVWQEHEKAGGALADITLKIAELSGLNEGAPKSGVSDPDGFA